MTPNEFQVWAAAFGTASVRGGFPKQEADKAVENYRRLGSPGPSPLRVLHLDQEGKTVEGPQTDVRNEMFDAVVSCFTDCQGLVKNSPEESDRYWELAEDLMRILSSANGEPILRKVED